MTAPIVIMGAHGGIGEKLTKILVANGNIVHATARNSDDVIRDTNIVPYSVDVFDNDCIESTIASADTGDGIKGLAYCIGSIDLKPLKATKNENFLNSYTLNVLGIVRALRAAEKSLKKANGSVVLFSTIAVQQGFANHSLISTSKGAVEGLTRSLAAEWAPDVRVNCIAPSLSDTPLAQPLTGSEKMSQSIAAMHPIPRLGTAQDSASLAAYLLNENAGWITGQVFHVDGGRSSLRVKG